MDRFDRIYRLHGIFNNRRTPITLKQIMEYLECSKSTADRDIQILRDHLNAPLEYNREENGYIYNQEPSSKPYQLPGLWFSAEELHGLLICQQILQNISPGILSEQINSPQPVIADKIHFPSVGRRLKDDNHFKRIATGLSSQRQIHIKYKSRGHESTHSERIISAQKLVYYRDNWYLAAQYHLKNELRIFSVDRIQAAKVQPQPAQQIPETQLQDYLHASYGIFTGKAKHIARLEFTKARANWAADKLWHPEQQGEWLANGNYQLSFPFSDSRELIMDILKHGAEVKVVTPEFLRATVKAEINKMQKIITPSRFEAMDMDNQK